MDIVEKLRLESSSGHVAYTEFILKLKRKQDCLFCFFEGKDDNKYYGIRIDNICQREFLPIECGGKENVITLKKLIDAQEEYKKISVAYFVDSDFDKKIEIENVYCLPSYSIENQYSTIDTLARILKNEFSLEEDDNDFSRILIIFKVLQDEFHKETTLINAWLACQSDNRKNLGIKTYLKIESTIGHYFTSIINSDLLTIRNFEDLNNLSTIQSLFSDAPQISQDELNLKIDYLKTQDPEINYRGKFELIFFINFLDKLKSEICKKRSPLFERKTKCSLRFEHPTALTSLSIYAGTPKCLIKYLNQKKMTAA
jgi:hypothetical protein